MVIAMLLVGKTLGVPSVGVGLKGSKELKFQTWLVELLELLRKVGELPVWLVLEYIVMRNYNNVRYGYT